MAKSHVFFKRDQPPRSTSLVLTLDIENDGLASLLVDDRVREDARDEEEPTRLILQAGASVINRGVSQGFEVGRDCGVS